MTRTVFIDARHFHDRMNLAGGVAVFIRTYAWVASHHQPPQTLGRSANLPRSTVPLRQPSRFPNRYGIQPFPE